MASRTAKVASSIVAGILVGAPLAAPRNAANAAECLTEPGKDGTRGQHWYYRIEHGTKRHCWYLRGADGKASQTAPSDDSDQDANVATQNSENPPHSLEDARAEFPLPQQRESTRTAPVPGPALLASDPVPASLQAADSQGSAVAARWPSSETAVAPPAPQVTPPAPQVAAAATDAGPATVTTTDAAPTDSDAPAATPAPVAAPPTPAKPSASLQMLFAVIGGALALAGLTASIVYRFGRRKQRRLDTRERRAVLWESVETGPRPPWVPPEIEEEPAPPPPPTPERRTAQSAVPPERYEKIEEILAQLVKQAQQSDA